MESQTIKDFVILPRKIRDDYLSGKLTKNELDVLIWIWLSTNPYNGFFSADYKALERDFQGRISYDNIRKIISSLRKKQCIYFLNHKGRKGSFPVFPINFILTNRKIQTLNYLENKSSITTQSQPDAQPQPKPENNLGGQYHNFKEQKDGLMKRFSVDASIPQITTLYNDTDNKNNIIVNKKYLEKSTNRFVPEEVILVEGFHPSTYEEEKCWQIAKSLGETDMRFILSCLKPKNGGFRAVEKAWGTYKEIPLDKIRSPQRYFNWLIKKITKEDGNNTANP